MKYTEDMDVDLPSKHVTNGEILVERRPAKSDISPSLHSDLKVNIKSLMSNGLNGAKHPVQSISNGNVSPDSLTVNPTESNPEEIGFEVESYSDFNSPLPCESHSEDKYGTNKEEFREHKTKEKQNKDNSCEKVNFESDSHELELLNDSSHLSEEFNLRLSDDDDDDDSSQESTQVRTSKNSPSDPVSSTTEEGLNPPRTFCPSIDEDKSSSGSGTLEGTKITNESHPNLRVNDSVKSDFHQAELIETVAVANLQDAALEGQSKNEPEESSSKDISLLKTIKKEPGEDTSGSVTVQNCFSLEESDFNKSIKSEPALSKMKETETCTDYFSPKGKLENDILKFDYSVKSDENPELKTVKSEHCQLSDSIAVTKHELGSQSEVKNEVNVVIKEEPPSEVEWKEDVKIEVKDESLKYEMIENEPQNNLESSVLDSEKVQATQEIAHNSLENEIKTLENEVNKFTQSGMSHCENKLADGVEVCSGDYQSLEIRSIKGGPCLKDDIINSKACAHDENISEKASMEDRIQSSALEIGEINSDISLGTVAKKDEIRERRLSCEKGETQSSATVNVMSDNVARDCVVDICSEVHVEKQTESGTPKKDICENDKHQPSNIKKIEDQHKISENETTVTGYNDSLCENENVCVPGKVQPSASDCIDGRSGVSVSEHIHQETNAHDNKSVNDILVKSTDNCISDIAEHSPPEIDCDIPEVDDINKSINFIKTVPDDVQKNDTEREDNINESARNLSIALDASDEVSKDNADLSFSVNDAVSMCSVNEAVSNSMVKDDDVTNKESSRLQMSSSSSHCRSVKDNSSLLPYEPKSKDIDMISEEEENQLLSCESERPPSEAQNTTEENDTECLTSSVFACDVSSEKNPQSPKQSDLLITEDCDSTAIETKDDCNESENTADNDSAEVNDVEKNEMKGGSEKEQEDGEIASTLETEAEDSHLSVEDLCEMDDVERNCPSESMNSSPSISPTFCESTLLDSSTDETEIQDCSSSINHSNTLKEHEAGFSSRKRTLSHTDDDTCDSSKSKKLNGFQENNSGAAHPKLTVGTQHESGQKRRAHDSADTDPKKLCIGNDLKETDNFVALNEGQHEKDAKKSEEMEQLGMLQNAAGLQKVSISDPPQESATFLDLAIERVVANAAAASPVQPMDLPFLRKLHKKELSNMSRSDLEELVLQKMCEAITERSTVGELRRRCQALENIQEKDKERFNSLRKQMHELSIVMKKYLDQQKNNISAPPIRVTRSVGLQVCQAIKPSCPTHGVRSKPFFPCQLPKTPPVSKAPSTTPTRQDPTPIHTPHKSPQASPVTPTRNPPVLSPQALRSMSNAITSTDPPSLVPVSAPSSTISSLPAATRPTPTTPRSQVPPPPLHQFSSPRPRLSIPTSIASPMTQVALAQLRQQPNQSKPSSPQTTNRPGNPNNDVEIIDIDKDEPSQRSAGVKISNEQQQHQHKQAANAAAQNLAGNSGMTVRLISPTQVSQSGVGIPSGFSQLILPSQGLPKNMIIPTSSQGNPIRGNLKLLVKANTLIPLKSTNGGTVTSTVVHIPSSTQAAVQQIFTNAGAGNRTNTVATVRQVQSSNIHPAPLPVGPVVQANNPTWKQIPPRPNLKIQHQNNGIVLSWNMVLGSSYADIESYQLYAYQEGATPPSAGLWKKVGDVKALPLPMACTLTQFVEGHRYHFTVRAVDKHGRVGPFSQQGSIRLGN